MEYVQIEVSAREEKGTTAVNRLRRAGVLPGVLYGMGRPNLDLSIAMTEFDRFVRSGSHLVQLRMGDAVRAAILREVQIDPLTDTYIHADFTRVSDDVAIEDSCHIVFKGRPKGTAEGGVFQTLNESVTVKALPRDLPGEVTIDVAGLELGDVVYARDVPFESGVELISNPDEPLAQVTTPKAVAVEEAPAEEGAAEEGAEGADAAPAGEDAAADTPAES